MGTTGPASINPATGKPYRPRSSGGHHRRHGARPGHADRPARHRDAVLRRRRLDGRHAGAAMGGDSIPKRVFSRHAHRHGGAAFLAEHRLSRSRPAGDHGRPGLARRPLSRTGRAPGERPRRSPAWPPTSPIFPKRRCSANSAANCRTATVRPFPSTPISRSRTICAIRARPSSTASTPIPISMSPAPAIISISRGDYGGSLALAFNGARPASAWSPSPPTGSIPTVESRAIVHALNAGGASVSFVEIATDKGHDAFLLDEPDFIATTRGFLRGARRRARGLSDSSETRAP